jgi:hypothetical protein
MMNGSIECAKQYVRDIIAGSKVQEDPGHAENTVEWLLRLLPEADEALQMAALSHDIERAIETRKVRHTDYENYDAFKWAHACNSAKILREILEKCEVDKSFTDEVCRLVTYHEIGGDYRSDLLKNADSLSYFAVNLPIYYQREGWEETKQRCIWGYQRLSVESRKMLQNMTYEQDILTRLLKEVAQEVDTITIA